MSATGEKVAYVKRQGQDRRHECHWPGCERQVPPAMWGCRAHWYQLPKALRDRIWATYEIGQERSMRPSEEYLEAARAVQEWIAEQLAAWDDWSIVDDVPIELVPVVPTVLGPITVSTLRDVDVAAGSRRCRGCGCTDNFGCALGCWWLEDDLCNLCVGRR